MCRRPIGVLSEYQIDPMIIDAIPPRRVIRIIDINLEDRG
jgi:hypothetical protein